MGRTALLSLIDGKPCATSVKIILFEKIFGQTSPLFKHIFYEKTGNINVNQRLRQRNTSIALSRFSYTSVCRRPLLSAVLLR